MQETACPAGTTIPEPDVSARVRAFIRSRTLHRAAIELGVSKAALLAVAAAVPLRRGTVAVVIEALDRAEVAEASHEHLK